MESGLGPADAERMVHRVMRQAAAMGAGVSIEQRLRVATLSELAPDATCDRSGVFRLPRSVNRPAALGPAIGSVFDRIWRREWRRNLLQACIERVGSEVDARQYRAFRLLVLQSWTTDATAEFLKMSSGSVHMATTRVLVRVRELVEQEAAR